MLLVTSKVSRRKHPGIVDKCRPAETQGGALEVRGLRCSATVATLAHHSAQKGFNPIFISIRQHVKDAVLPVVTTQIFCGVIALKEQQRYTAALIESPLEEV